jgi:hypothetical protein
MIFDDEPMEGGSMPQEGGMEEGKEEGGDEAAS